MEPSRKIWNARQKELRVLISDSDRHLEAIELFLQQHAEVHTGAMSVAGKVSFEDEVLDDLTDSQIRELPDRMDHSIAWVLWHLARIEDVTMNMLVAGEDQLFIRDSWKAKLGITILHTGNAMSRSEVVDISYGIDLDELRHYRLNVGRETEKIVKQLTPEVMGQKVSQSRIKRLRAEEVVDGKAEGIIEYWSKRTIAGLLLMPPTRHCFIHLNEAMRIRRKVI